MRQALLSSLPALTKFYGLTPADIDEMTGREVSEYLDQYADYQAKQESG